jgi:hypothetical protein
MEIAYPAVKLLAGDPRVYAYADAREFHRASADLIGIYRNAVFIDAAGWRYRIREAFRVGWGTWLLGYHPLLKGRIARIDFAVEDRRRLGLEEFKREITGRLKPSVSRPGWYPNPPGKALPRIERAASFAEVMGLFLYEIDEED